MENKGRKLLLAEDTQDLNRAVKAMLTMQGYEVDAAFDGEEALGFLGREVYDGVILDIMMPKKDGLTVLSEMRERGDLTPVLLLTAKAEVDDRVTGLEAGADDYLAKPFAMKELLARVHALTRRGADYGAKRLTYRDLTLDQETLELAAANTMRLSMKECELLRVLIQGAGRTMEAAHLIERVFPGKAAGEEALTLYLNYLRAKLRSVDTVVEIRGSLSEGFFLAERADE